MTIDGQGDYERKKSPGFPGLLVRGLRPPSMSVKREMGKLGVRMP